MNIKDATVLSALSPAQLTELVVNNGFDVKITMLKSINIRENDVYFVVNCQKIIHSKARNIKGYVTVARYNGNITLISYAATPWKRTLKY